MKTYCLLWYFECHYHLCFSSISSTFFFLPFFLSLSPRPPPSSYKCRSMLLSEYYKNTFFIAMKIKAQPIYTRYYVTWCVSLFPISFLLAVGLYIYTCLFSAIPSFTIFFAEFFIFLRRRALFFISCNIFLCCFPPLRYMLFPFAFIRIFVFIFLRTFCKFLWMEKLFSFLSSRSLTT